VILTRTGHARTRRTKPKRSRTRTRLAWTRTRTIKDLTRKNKDLNLVLKESLSQGLHLQLLTARIAAKPTIGTRQQ